MVINVFNLLHITKFVNCFLQKRDTHFVYSKKNTEKACYRTNIHGKSTPYVKTTYTSYRKTISRELYTGNLHLM